MINSVGEYVAGERYNLKKEEGNRFIQMGYADGEPTQDVAEIREGDTLAQVVTLGG